MAVVAIRHCTSSCRPKNCSLQTQHQRAVPSYIVCTNQLGSSRDLQGIRCEKWASLTDVLITVVGTEVVSVNVKGTEVTNVDVAVSVTGVVTVSVSVVQIVRSLVTVTG